MRRSKDRINKLILGEGTVDKLAELNILLVGAGGIGCEVVKNLSRVGVKRVTILDFDTIEETNLNRQFYFRKSHVGSAKASVIKQQIKKIVPELEVTAICDNLYNKRFNSSFYHDFDLIISALDSIKAREHLAKQATKNGKPMIDAGTMSYHGQAYATIRFLTTCHNCEPSRVEVETGVACLVRSRPERPIHCGTYAKNFYQSFFGNGGETMSDRLKPDKYLGQLLDYTNQEELKDISKALFKQLFYDGLIDGEMGKKVRKLTFQEALNSQKIVNNPQSDLKQKQFSNPDSPYEQQNLWSLSKYAQKYQCSMINLLKRKNNQTLPSIFEKDDEDCMLLVCCITNFRTYNFINYDSQDNQLKYLTLYQCKDLVGNVMPAIASTNSIAAALQIRQLINITSKRLNLLRVIHFTHLGDERLSPCYQSQPLLTCNVCSQNIIYAKVELDMQKVLFEQFQKFAEKELFSFGRDLYSGPYVLIRNGRKDISPNKQKPISFVQQMATQGILPISFMAGLTGTPITVHVSIVHKKGQEGIKKIDTPSKKDLRLQLKKFFKRQHQNRAMKEASELNFYGGFQL